MAKQDGQQEDSEHLKALTVEIKAIAVAIGAAERGSRYRLGSLAEWVAAIAAIVGLYLVLDQLKDNYQATKVSIRGQLYQSETDMAAAEVDNEEQYLTTLWAVVPSTVTAQEFSATLLRLVTDDPTALKAKNAEELHRSMFDAATFADKKRRDDTKNLRNLFYSAQANLYHVHNAFDYQHEGILSENEFATWKSYIREMNAHPMLLTVISQGYRYHYFSREFGKFLQEELCADTAPPGDPDPIAYERGKKFIQLFYPDMLAPDWPNKLADY